MILNSRLSQSARIFFQPRAKSNASLFCERIPQFSRSRDAVIMFVRESKVYFACHKERIKHLIHTIKELDYDVYIFINARSKDKATITISSEEQKMIKSKFRDPLLDLPNVTGHAKSLKVVLKLSTPTPTYG